MSCFLDKIVVGQRRAGAFAAGGHRQHDLFAVQQHHRTSRPPGSMGRDEGRFPPLVADDLAWHRVYRLDGARWQRLIYRDGLTIGTNLFGTTYYTLVGFHASHVIIGIVAMIVVLGLARAGNWGTTARRPSNWSRGTGTLSTVCGLWCSRWSICLDVRSSRLCGRRI